MAKPRVFTIPASAPFLPTLIGALLNGRLVEGFPAGHEPLALTSATLYLPTRRACRLARNTFLAIAGERAAILPRIVAIGDIDEDEIAFAEAATGAIAPDALDLPPALSALERRLLLTQLVREWASRIAPKHQGEAALVANNPASALALADDLARLMDDMTTRQVPWERLDRLVPDDLDRYWQLTLEFLKIARETWPVILAERGKIEPASRRDALIKAEAGRLACRKDGTVIAAGSTGSMPATADLLATIAALPHGAVVLPGLDIDLDADAWELIAGQPGAGRETVAPAVGHPQFAMQSLLRRIGITRDEVIALAEPAAHGRERILSEAMLPASATDRWHEHATRATPAPAARSLAKLALVEAANAEEEALAIAVALRESVERSDKTSALVAPDRALARRVLAQLGRWRINVDDTGGDALPDTPAGRFARLAAEAALEGLSPVSLLALLKHRLFRLGADEGEHVRGVAALERAVLRGSRPRPGSAGLAQALASFRAQLEKLRRGQSSELHPADPRSSLTETEVAAAGRLVQRLTGALAPLERLAAVAQPLADLASRHREVIAALAAEPAQRCVAFVDADGAALADAFDELVLDNSGLTIAPTDYPELFRTVIADRVVRRREQPEVRVRIYGRLEARLQHVDRMVVGGLIEGGWPPDPRCDPWLSRPMRHALGLDLPERRISLSAHDFVQVLGADEVILTYPAKLAGTPTVPSRFLQRLAAVAGHEWSAVRARGENYLAWARMLDRAAQAPQRIKMPAPRPPREARPLALSVTDVESWLRDPYSIYAKHVLKLRELAPVDLAPGAADRGMVIHAALGEFTNTFADALPDDVEAELLAIGRKHFARLDEYPEARAFWWPRFKRIARWIAGWEAQRRVNVASIAAEIPGKIEIPVGERVFTLRSRADRIERLADGSYAILDYKTGRVPTEPQVRTGVAPQLTLEAAILRAGGFGGIPAGATVSELAYVSLKGGVPAGDNVTIRLNDDDPGVHAARALDNLKALATRFEDEQQPYLPLVMPMWKNRHGSYDHLARVKEWSVGRDEEDAQGGGE